MPKAKRDTPLDRWCSILLETWRHLRQPGRRQAEASPERSLSSAELNEVVAGVKQLSLGLTRERKLVGQNYMDNPKLLGAYLLFYWPVSYAQAASIFQELDGLPKSVLDLGCGPGPMTFAAIDAGARLATAADRSARALELARSLSVRAGIALSTRSWTPAQPIPEGAFDLIVMGHALNELFDGDIVKRSDFIEKLSERLTPQGTVVLIEPALKDTTRALLQVRDTLVARGFAVKAPCFFRGPCPALVKPTDWCHAERQWTVPPLVDQIAHAAQLHKSSVKMSYLMLSRRDVAWKEAPQGNVFRIVSEPLEGKGRLRYMGCGAAGRTGLALQTKHENENNRTFMNLQRGDVIRVSTPEEKGDGLALDDTSTVERIAWPGQRV
jgi:ribosomal protein RSM22 (predicted rRNA methylase)